MFENASSFAGLDHRANLQNIQIRPACTASETLDTGVCMMLRLKSSVAIQAKKRGQIDFSEGSRTGGLDFQRQYPSERKTQCLKPLGTPTRDGAQ